MSAPCSACGRENARSSIGGTLVCSACRPALIERLDAARAAGRAADAAKEARAMLRETARDYILRDIPADLWQQAKHAAIDRGASLRELILAALRREVR